MSDTWLRRSTIGLIVILILSVALNQFLFVRSATASNTRKILTTNESIIHEIEPVGSEYFPAVYGIRLKITDFFLSIFTGGLLVATWLLWKGAEDTKVRQLRAYVGVENAVTVIMKGPNGIRFAFKIKNSGQTPAYQLQNRGAVVILPHPMPPNTPFPVLSTIEASRSVLHASADCEGHAETNVDFTPAEIGRIDENNRVYFFTRVDYIDAFKKARWTTACLSIIGNPFNINGQLTIIHASQHNDAI
jgi:hypothetical protein